jgi:glyoxylase-like metal-dependent hydrolase (beta-lactamase superfamily II)
MNRRTIFTAGLVAIAPLTLQTPSASAQAIAGPVQAVAGPGNTGHYRFRVGDIRATVVSDGTLAGSPRLFAGNAPAEELDRALRDALRPPESTVLNLNTLLLEVAGRKVLVEAGAAQTMGPNGGALFARLAAIGVRAEEIDVIIVTHTHPDHVGNLRRADGGAAFPNAAVHVPEADWTFFVRDEPDLSHLPMPPEFRQRFIAAIKRSVEPIVRTAILYRPGSEIVPGVTTIPAAGHTPGMAAVLIHSGSDQLLITSDAAYDPLLNMERLWRPGPDLDQEAAARVRRSLFDRAAADRIPVLGFHFPFPGLGRITTNGDAYRWVPARWEFAG